jgi:hypothetical protein
MSDWLKRVPQAHGVLLVVFEHEPGEPLDALTISDEYVVPDKQGECLCLNLPYEGTKLDRAAVVRLHAALGEWLALRAD